jgi:hypothetical protein
VDALDSVGLLCATLLAAGSDKDESGPIGIETPQHQEQLDVQGRVLGGQVPESSPQGSRQSKCMAEHNDHTLHVRVGEVGETSGRRGHKWGRRPVRVTMIAGWQADGQVKGPFINHTCCTVHQN